MRFQTIYYINYAITFFGAAKILRELLKSWIVVYFLDSVLYDCMT
jgi:hypothetical protein